MMFPERSPRMKTLLIVYHSHTGGSEQLALAASSGADEEPEIRVDLRPAAATDVASVLQADGFLFATPENLGSMAGMLKDFFDRVYYPALDHLAGRPYASLICAGSDGQGAARQIARIATGWRLKAVAEPLIVLTQAQTPAAILARKQLPAPELARCRELGAALASGLALGIF